MCRTGYSLEFNFFGRIWWSRVSFINRGGGPTFLTFCLNTHGALENFIKLRKRKEGVPTQTQYKTKELFICKVYGLFICPTILRTTCRTS